MPASCRTARRRSFCWARRRCAPATGRQRSSASATLPRQGLTQLLQPLLIAWSQQGDGRTDAALATLRPFIDGQRFRGIYALHAALIADQAGRSAEAAKLYRQAQTEFGGMNLRLAQILASAQARHGHLGEAQRILAGLAADAPDMSIALPALTAASMTPAGSARDRTGSRRPISRSRPPCARRTPATSPCCVLRLAIDLRPDFTAARLLAADILDGRRHTENALQMLAAVASDDPLIAVVRLQRAALTERLGHSEEAMHAMQRIARDYPDSSIPAMREGDLLRAKQRFAEAIGAYDRAIARIKTPGPTDWLVFTIAASATSVRASGPRRRPTSSTR